MFNKLLFISFICLGVFISSVSAAPLISDADLVMYYDFDSVGATVADGSGQGNDATVVGNVTGNPYGRSGADAIFGGTSSDALDVTATALADRPSSAITIAAWCKIDDTEDHQSIFNAYGPKPSDPGSNAYLYHMEIRTGSNQYRWCVRNEEGETIGNLQEDSSVITGDAEVITGEWMHFACTYDSAAADGNNLKVYINGKYEYGIAADSGLTDLNAGTNWDNGAAIGYTADGLSRNYKGQMDEFYMFKRALTAAEISTLASASWLSNGGFETGDITGWTEWDASSEYGEWGEAGILDVNSSRTAEIAPGVFFPLDAYQGDYSCYIMGGNQYGIAQTVEVPAGTLVQVDAQWAGTFIVGGNGWAEIKALTHAVGADYNMNESAGDYTGDEIMVAKTDTYGPLNEKDDQSWDWEDAPADSPIDGNQFISKGEVVIATKFGGFSNGRGMVVDNIALTPLYSVTSAYEPVPTDGSSTTTDSNTVVVEFSWTEGYLAASHDVYLGTDFNDVNDATNASPEFMGNQIANSYSPTLSAATEYFWRIDEVNGVDIWKGDVWSFTVLKVPDPGLLWEMDSEDDFTVGDGSGGSAGGRLYITNNMTGYKYAGMTATSGIGFDADEGAVYMDGIYPCKIYGLTGNSIGEDPNLLFTSSTQYTFSMFAKGDKSAVTGNGYSFYLFFSSGQKFKCDLSWNPAASASFTSPGGGWQSSAYHIWDPDPAYADRYVDPETWNLYTFVWDADNQAISTYVNGVQRGGPYASGTPIAAGAVVTDFGFGDGYGWHGPGGWFKDYRVYSTALNEDQIQFILGDFLLYPKSPNPKDNSEEIALDGTVLTWTHGLETVSQDIYFGTDETIVANADTSSSTYQGQIALEDTFNPGSLELMKTYYWRVDQLDENGELIVKGPVWQFSSIESIIVDDFESYDDEGNSITAVWDDKLGWGDIQISRQNDPCLSPVNSMRLRYHVTYSPYYAVANRSFSPAQDWTLNGVKILTIHYYGDEDNFGLPMFVTIGDGVTDANVVIADFNSLSEGWNEINVNLFDIAAAGVDLTNVSYMEIGFGNGTNVGMMSSKWDYLYVDDIALYPSKCIPSESSLEADLTGDCVVNYDDLSYVVAGWLKDTSAETLAAANPVGLWLFDDDTDLTKATIGNDMVASGDAPVAVAGMDSTDGAAMIKLGSYLIVDQDIVPAPGEANINEYTMVWDVSIPAASAYRPLRWVGLCEFDTVDLLTDVDISVIYAKGGVSYDDGLFGTHQGWSGPLVKPDKWYQLAVSVSNGEFFNCYVNGELAVSTPIQDVDGRYSIVDTFHLFKDNDGEDPDINCSTFALFDRALTADEIKSLVSCQIIGGDVNDDAAVDFADYSILANEWLVEDLWP